jgi:hypothetical protein
VTYYETGASPEEVVSTKVDGGEADRRRLLEVGVLHRVSFLYGDTELPHPREGCIEDIDGVGVLCNEVNVPGVVKILGLSAG